LENLARGGAEESRDATAGGSGAEKANRETQSPDSEEELEAKQSEKSPQPEEVALEENVPEEYAIVIDGNQVGDFAKLEEISPELLSTLGTRGVTQLVVGEGGDEAMGQVILNVTPDQMEPNSEVWYAYTADCEGDETGSGVAETTDRATNALIEVPSSAE
jgi:hypothetical protein